MDHAPRVGIGHRLADLLEDRQEPRAGPCLPGSVALGLEQRGQGPPLDQLHGEVRPAVGEGPQLVDRHDPRVLQLAADLRLLDEPAHDLGVALVRLQQHLDGQVAAQVDVAALEDRPHAAAGDLALELVPARAPPRASRASSADRGLTSGSSLVGQVAQVDARRRAVAEIPGSISRLGGRAASPIVSGSRRPTRSRRRAGCRRPRVGQVHHLQAGPQLLGERRVLGQQPLGVDRPARLEVGQVGFEDPAQLGVVRRLEPVSPSTGGSARGVMAVLLQQLARAC